MTSQDLDIPFRVVSPTTGEVLTTASPTEELGRFLADVRDHESHVKEMKQAVTIEILARMDRSAAWTHRLEGLKLSAPSPEPVEEFDALALREELLLLVDAGVIAVEAVDAAVETVVTYKTRKAGVNALRRLGGAVRETIDRHATAAEPRRYVTVRRA